MFKYRKMVGLFCFYSGLCHASANIPYLCNMNLSLKIYIVFITSLNYYNSYRVYNTKATHASGAAETYNRALCLKNSRDTR